MSDLFSATAPTTSHLIDSDDWLQTVLSGTTRITQILCCNFRQKCTTALDSETSSPSPLFRPNLKSHSNTCKKFRHLTTSPHLSLLYTPQITWYQFAKVQVNWIWFMGCHKSQVLRRSAILVVPQPPPQTLLL